MLKNATPLHVKNVSCSTKRELSSGFLNVLVNWSETYPFQSKTFSWLPITRTSPANSKYGNFCFPSDYFHLILPSVKKNSVLQSETFNLFQNSCVFFAFLLFVQSCILIKLCCLIPTFSQFPRYFIYLLLPWIEVCMILALPPHPFVYLLISGYFLRTLDNSNFFRFS